MVCCAEVRLKCGNVKDKTHTCTWGISCVSCKIENLSTRTHTHTHIDAHALCMCNHNMSNANTKLSATNLPGTTATATTPNRHVISHCAAQPSPRIPNEPPFYTMSSNKLSCCMRFVNVTLSCIWDYVGIGYMHRSRQPFAKGGAAAGRTALGWLSISWHAALRTKILDALSSTAPTTIATTTVSSNINMFHSVALQTRQ